MRCPKCSFISFDIIESCAKCGKNISKAAEELMGTIAEVTAPIFLQFDAGEPDPEADVLSETEVPAEEEITVDIGGEEQDEVEFSLDETVDFEIGEDDSAEGEPEIELAAEESEEEELGISDLAPSEEVAVADPVEDGMVLEEEVAVEAVSADASEAGELEDLEVEGIDLESKPVSAGKVMPSVKTGTALDDFDIDLGDLITGEKKE